MEVEDPMEEDDGRNLRLLEDRRMEVGKAGRREHGGWPGRQGAGRRVHGWLGGAWVGRRTVLPVTGDDVGGSNNLKF